MPASSAFVTLPGQQANLPLDLPRDFVPVGFVAAAALHAGRDLIARRDDLAGVHRARQAQARRNFSYATTGRGTLSHLTGEGLQQRTGIKLLVVPYLGGTPAALNDVLSGRVPMVIDAYAPLAGALQTGAIRALAVGADRRLPDFADLPTIAETLPGFSPGGWLALVAPVRHAGCDCA